MPHIPEEVRRRMIRDDLLGSFEATIEQRVERYLEVFHQPITPNPHFAAASAECIKLYRDGYFLSTVMVTQAVAEGIRKFVVERTGTALDNNMNGQSVVALLCENNIISENCAAAFNRIWGSFRNDVHHMNPKIATIDFRDLARRNITDLATIEREIFDFKLDNGKIVPTKPEFWDIPRNGRIPVFLRLGP